MKLDKEQLLVWLREQFKNQEANRDRLEIGHQYWEYHEGASDYLEVVIKQIESGKFDVYEKTP